MFSYYAATVKNLRGVILFENYNRDVEKVLKWLNKRFKYRDIGIYKDLYHLLPNDLRRRFIKLDYPINSIARFSNNISTLKLISDNLLDSLMISSIYIAPLYSIASSYKDKLKEFAIEKIFLCKSMDNKSIKLHLRIADYTMLDLYKDRVLENIRVIETLKNKDLFNKEIEKVFNARIRLVKKDLKRYWRIKCERGMIFLLYIDLMKIIYDYILKKVVSTEFFDTDIAAALSIIPVVFLNRNIIKELGDKLS